MFREPENMAGPILASTYKRWQALIAKAERDSALVDVLDFSDFPEVHGFGALDEIHPGQERGSGGALTTNAKNTRSRT